MKLHFEKYYSKLDAESRYVYHVWALCPSLIDVSELLPIVHVKQTITKTRLSEILDEGKRTHAIRGDYYSKYQLDGHFLVWMFPLVNDYAKEKRVML